MITFSNLVLSASRHSFYKDVDKYLYSVCPAQTFETRARLLYFDRWIPKQNKADYLSSLLIFRGILNVIGVAAVLFETGRLLAGGSVIVIAACTDCIANGGQLKQL